MISYSIDWKSEEAQNYVRRMDTFYPKKNLNEPKIGYFLGCCRKVAMMIGRLFAHLQLVLSQLISTEESLPFHMRRQSEN